MNRWKNWIADQLRWAAYLAIGALVVLAAERASHPSKPQACWTCRYVAHQMGREIPAGFACGPTEHDHFVADLTAYSAYCRANHVQVDYHFD